MRELITDMRLHVEEKTSTAAVYLIFKINFVKKKYSDLHRLGIY
jgi:hypothetical protein